MTPAERRARVRGAALEGGDRTASRDRRRTGKATQGALLVVAGLLGVLAFASASPSLWPLALFAAAVPWVPFAGRPAAPPALLLGVSLLATTAAAHAVFFGEDRYHVVATPVLALLAAAAFRRPRASTS